jgi:hypothetical protein
MVKKLLIFTVAVLALLCLFFAYNYFANPVVKAPDNSFKGPSSGQPSAEGPTALPPER